MKPTSVAAVIVFLLLMVSTASAQICAAGEDPFDVRLPGVQKGGYQFNIFTTYCLTEITAGRTVPVTVRIETELIPGAPLLEIKEVPALSKDDLDRVKFSPADAEPENKQAVSVQKYSYMVQISDQAEPRKYMVQLDLGFPDNNPDKERVHRSFALPVGVNSKGKLEVSKDSPGSLQAAMFSRAKHGYTLKLRNFFRDYTTYVESITVSSDPAGWISPITLKPGENEIWSIAPTGEKTFSFDFDTTALSGNLVRSFAGTPPQLKFDIRYNDGFRRQLTYDEGRQPINISPSGWVLLGSVLLGLLLGALVRAALEFKLSNRQITRSGVIYSLAFGLLMVFLAAAGQLEVKSKAFSLSSSYDNPLAMLMIGLISALAGLQIIIGWYKSLKSE